MNEIKREINLLDLCIEILLRWRRIMVCMLVGAILFAGVSYVKSAQTVVAQKAGVENAKASLEELLKEAQRMEKEAELELELEIQTEFQDGELDPAKLNRKILEKQMTDTQLYNVDNVLTNEKLLKDKSAYVENSVLMKLDPNSVKKAEVIFYITSPDMTKTYNIQKVYEDLVCSGQLMKAIVAKTDMKAEAVAEVVGLEKSTYSSMEGADSVRVYVKHYEEAAALKMIQAVIDFVAQKQEELLEELGDHEITALESSVTALMDANVMTQQQSYFREINNLRKSIIDSKKAFSKLEWRYYDIRLNGELTELSEQKIAEMEEKELEAAKAAAANKAIATASMEDIESLEAIIETGVTATTGISAKYIVLGMVLAAFAYAFVVLLQCIFNNKICITDSLQEMYNITQLGRIPEAQDKKRLLGFVDQWLIAMRDRNRRSFSEAEALELAAVAVKMAAARAATDTVYLIGCDLKERSLSVCGQLKKTLQQDNIQVKVLNNVLYNAQELEQLQNARCTVLVEKAGATLYDEIAQELALLKRQDIAVLGGIIVE